MNKYVLKFNPDIVEKPILSEVILETKKSINILRAKVDYNEGMMIVSIPGSEEDQRKVVKALSKRGVEVSRLRTTVVIDVERCVNCGACISVCPAGVISFDKEKKIKMDTEKCHRCGVCIEVCPRRAIFRQEKNDERVS